MGDNKLQRGTCREEITVLIEEASKCLCPEFLTEPGDMRTGGGTEPGLEGKHMDNGGTEESEGGGVTNSVLGGWTKEEQADGMIVPKKNEGSAVNLRVEASVTQ